MATFEPSWLATLTESAGLALARAWLAYLYVLLFLVFLGLSFVVFLGVAWAAARGAPLGPRGGRLLLALEVVFGLVHPVIYLAVLVPSSIDAGAPVEATPSALDPLAWALLAGLWGLRLVPLAPSALRRRAVAATCFTGLVLVTVYAVDDLAALARSWLVALPYPESKRYHTPILIDLGLLGLYLAPFAMLAYHLRQALSADRFAAAGDFRLAAPRPALVLTAALTALLAVSQLLLVLRPSDQRVRAWIGEQRAAVHAAADRTGTDPRLLGALLYVVQREQISVFGRQLEAALASAWVADERHQTLPVDALDPSIGPAQIKPHTAVVALGLADAVPPAVPGQARRVSAPNLGPHWQWAPGTWDDLRVDPAWFDRRGDVTAQLQQAAPASFMAALILELHARQWEQADPAWSIRSRPEILATLYQLGFARSVPKADPGSNAFGRRVARVMEAPWLAAALARPADS